MMTRLGMSALVATVIVLFAYRARALTFSGGVTAFVVGTITLGCGGLAAGGALLAFFISSSLLTHVGRRRKRVANVEYAKGGRRDWAQVLANGGVATLVALSLCLGVFGPASRWQLFALAGALAAATADTWATEVGGLSSRPRLITTGQDVPPGTSGGVTWLGFLASLLGGLWIGVVVGGMLWLGKAFPWGNSSNSSDVWWVLVAASLAGLGGSLWDSVLGSTVQAMYWCPTCEKETERRVHKCGTRTQFLRGWRWMSNDVVNFTATCIGCIIATLLGLVGR